MSESQSERLFAVLKGEERYGPQVDDALRRIAEFTTGDYLIKWFSSLNDESASFAGLVVDHAEMSVPKSSEPETSIPCELSDSAKKRIGVRVRFTCDEAAYYQFHVFPSAFFNAEMLPQMSRKRFGASQLILFVPQPHLDLTIFMELCKSNPHVMGVEEIAEDEFWSAPSNSV